MTWFRVGVVVTLEAPVLRKFPNLNDLSRRALITMGMLTARFGNTCYETDLVEIR